MALRVDTICVHGDTPGAQALTRALRAGLERAGVASRRSPGTAAVTCCFGWWREGTPEGRRALTAAGLGWMLDAFDVMLFALVLPAIRTELGLSAAAGGALGSVALLAAAAGGVGFGWIADRFGRTRALMASVVLYSVFTAACGLAHDVHAVRRVPHLPRPRHGRRVGERRRAGLGNVVRRSTAARRSR